MKRGRPSDLVLFVSVDFFDDPKIASLTVAEREFWLRILMEQLRTGNGGELPMGCHGASKKRVERYLEAGLIYRNGTRLHIHAWDDWNGREAYKRFLTRERVRRLRARRNGDL